jgi:hypothetical protein
MGGGGRRRVRTRLKEMRSICHGQGGTAGILTQGMCCTLRPHTPPEHSFSQAPRHQPCCERLLTQSAVPAKSAGSGDPPVRTRCQTWKSLSPAPGQTAAAQVCPHAAPSSTARRQRRSAACRSPTQRCRYPGVTTLTQKEPLAEMSIETEQNM